MHANLAVVLVSTVLMCIIQGNPPIYIITRKMREDACSSKTPFLFYLFADDVNTQKRSDAAIYYVSLCDYLDSRYYIHVYLSHTSQLLL